MEYWEIVNISCFLVSGVLVNWFFGGGKKVLVCSVWGVNIFIADNFKLIMV